MTDRSVSTWYTVAALTAGALASAFTIALALYPLSQNLLLIILRIPGLFFVESFHIASFYIPAVLATGAAMVLARRTRLVSLGLLLGSVLPFFTLAVAVRLAADARVGDSPVTALLTAALGRGAASTVSFLLAAIQVGLMVLIWQRLRGARSDVGFSSAARADVSEQPGGADGHVPSRPDLRAADLTAGLPRIRALISAPRVLVPGSLVDLPEPDDGEEIELFFRGGEIRRVEAAELIDPAVEDEDDEYLVHEYLAGADAADADAADAEAADAAAADDDQAVDLELDEDASPESGAPPMPRSKRYSVPVSGLLHDYGDSQYWLIDDRTREAAEILRVTLDEFGIQAEVTGIRKGPVITMFEILPAPGVKLSKIVNLSDNIALRLAASSVRIVAPIPGKHAVGIEIPNKERAIVSFAELLGDESFASPRMEIPIALGKDIPGDAQIVDLTRMPHVLIAGATGSGKSVCVNSIICSILYRRSPHEVKLILIDPKIVELKFYNDVPHLLTPVITDPKRAFQALQYCIYEMERRYTLLDSLQVRDVQSYNRKIRTRRLATEPIPYIVVVVDEFADLMATSGKELEGTLARLAAMSRAVGIHLVLATQRPSTDVITGLFKANIPSRIAFMVASKIDSRIILDSMGAEKLLGRGDMLFTSAWDPFPVRMQGAYLSEDEVERVVGYVKQLGEPDYIDDEIFLPDDDDDYVVGELEDPLMEKAIEIVSAAGKASASYLQRRLKVGYNRAARMVEEMERMGIVGPQQGSKPRDVIGVGGGY